MADWRDAVSDEWKRRSSRDETRVAFPLSEQSFDADEIVAMTEVLLSGQLTMSSKVREFETAFAAQVGSPYAVMVNSGSSANLLSVACAMNPRRTRRLHVGDEVLVPAVCWSTSVWPLVQLGLKPVFIDVDPNTLNISLETLEAAASPKTRALMMVHVLGNCAPMDDVLEFARANQWIVIEDTCESLGSRWRGRSLGTLGDFGTYSFYFSHHMTTGEGGMVVARTQEDVDLLRSLRAHGWTRELSNRAEVEAQHADVDPRFCFVNVGFNFRPMEIQAALGLKQLTKLNTMNAARIANRAALIKALQAHPKWRGQFEFPEAPEGAEAIWFGFPVLLAESVKASIREYLGRLTAAGVENRPIVSGNFARQPALALMGLMVDPKNFLGAEQVHERGFFVGLHSQPKNDDELHTLATLLLNQF